MDIKKSRDALSRFCQGNERMCIPAHPDDDDMIISAAIDELERLQKTSFVTDKDWQEKVSEIERLRHELSAVTDMKNAYFNWYKNSRSKKLVLIEALQKIRSMTPYRVYMEIIDTALKNGGD